MGRPAHTGPGHFFSAYLPAEHLVELRKVAYVSQNDPHVDDVRQACTGSVEDGLEVFQGPQGLYFNSAVDNPLRLRVERTLAGHEQHVSEPYRLDDRRCVLHVGKAGDWGIVRMNDRLR